MDKSVTTFSETGTDKHKLRQHKTPILICHVDIW